jgi:hypothetical protein
LAGEGGCARTAGADAKERFQSDGSGLARAGAAWDWTDATRRACGDPGRR